jgi:hypothetical protein
LALQADGGLLFLSKQSFVRPEGFPFWRPKRKQPLGILSRFKDTKMGNAQLRETIAVDMGALFFSDNPTIARMPLQNDGGGITNRKKRRTRYE